MAILIGTNGLPFQVSDHRVDFTNEHGPWFVKVGKYTSYVLSTRDNGKTRLHRLLLGAKPGEWVDHINHDGADNRDNNIRIVTPSQNSMNRVKKPRMKGVIPESGLKGVHVRHNYKTWRAVICVDGKRTNLGDYDNELDAGLAYDRAAKLIHGDNALTNGIPDDGHVLARHEHSTRSKLLGSVSRHKSGKLQAFLKREYLGLFETEAKAREAIAKRRKETEDEHEDTNV